MTSKDVIEKFLSEAPRLKVVVSRDFSELSEDQLNHDRRHINQANKVLEKLEVYH